MQADPIISAPYFSEGLNPYSYTFNNPLNWVDPSGYCAEDQYPTEGGTVTVTCDPVEISKARAEEASRAAANQVQQDHMMQQGMQQGLQQGSATSHQNTSQSYPPGGGQWGPGNYPGDIAPSVGNELSGPGGMGRSAATGSTDDPFPRGNVVAGEPITDLVVRRALWDIWTSSDLGTVRAHEEGITLTARFVNGSRVFDSSQRWEPSLTLAEARETGQVPQARAPNLRGGAPQYVTAHTHPFPAGTVIYVDPKTGAQRAAPGPSIGDIASTHILRVQGYNVVDYIVAPEGTYRNLGLGHVQRIAPIGYINPVNY